MKPLDFIGVERVKGIEPIPIASPESCETGVNIHRQHTYSIFVRLPIRKLTPFFRSLTVVLGRAELTLSSRVETSTCHRANDSLRQQIQQMGFDVFPSGLRIVSDVGTEQWLHV